MKINAKTGQGQTGRSPEDHTAGGSVATIAQPEDRQRVALSARPLVLVTRGRVEYTAKCPGCTNWHRHRRLGAVKGPCGTAYELQPRRRRVRGK